MDAPKYRAGDEIAGTRYVFVSTLGEGGRALSTWFVIHFSMSCG